MQFNCPENVGEMIQENGKFNCQSCSRLITDFRGMSNEEIADEIARNSGKTCGVLESNQIVNPERSRFNALFRMAFAAVFILGLSSTALFGQETSSPYEVVNSHAENSVEEMKVKIRGTILEEDTGEPIPFARVWIEVKGERFAAMSDFDGRYQINVPMSLAAGRDLVLNVQYIGYEDLRVEGIVCKSTDEVVVVDVELKQYGCYIIVGIVINSENDARIDKNPYDFGKTVIKGDDLRRF